MFLANLSQGKPLWALSRQLLQTKLGRVSATEAASVLHLHPYRSKTALWKERHQTQVASAHGNCMAIQHGNTYEGDAVEAALHFLGSTSPWCTPGIVLGEDEVSCCSPDALWKDEGGGWHGLEVKCPFNAENVPTHPSEIRKDVHYILQAFHCLHSCGALDWHLFYYDPRNLNNRCLIKVFRNERVWEKMLSHFRNFNALTTAPPRKTKFDRFMGESLFREIRTELVL